METSQYNFSSSYNWFIISLYAKSRSTLAYAYASNRKDDIKTEKII